jgi:hypothetical protein
MMLYPVPFQAEHYWQVAPRDVAKPARTPALEQHVCALENEFAATLMEDGKPVAMAGVVPYWSGRVHLWTEIDEGAERKAHRFAKQFLDSLPFKRVETAVLAGNETAARWATHMGFQVECPFAPAYFPNGDAAALYALVRP